MSKLLSDEELTASIEQLYNKSRELGMIRTGDPMAFMVLHTLALIDTQKRLYAESVEVEVRLDEINRVVSRKYEHPSGRFIGRGKYYGRRIDELDAELRAEQKARIK